MKTFPEFACLAIAAGHFDWEFCFIVARSQIFFFSVFVLAGGGGHNSMSQYYSILIELGTELLAGGLCMGYCKLKSNERNKKGLF